MLSRTKLRCDHGLDHRVELQDQLETTSVSLFHIYKPPLSMIWSVVFQLSSEVYIDQHRSQMKVPTAYRNLRMDVEHHTVYRGEEMIALDTS